jgi:hypothetical protein
LYIVLMKRIPAVLMLAILLINAAGFYVYYIIELQRIHTAMRAQLRNLPEERLTRISLTPKEYADVNVEENEIRMHGQMFDIARLTVTDDSVIVFALHDKREDNLLAFLNDITSKPFSCETEVITGVIDYITLNYLLERQSMATTSFIGKTIIHNSAYLREFKSFFHLRNFQPPRVTSQLSFT